jgi:pyruvate kinase
MIEAGMNVARIGLAHSSLEEATERMRRVREVASQLGRRVGILIDLPGPKPRLAATDGRIELVEGATVRLVPGTHVSTSAELAIDYAGVLGDLRVGESIGLGDGTTVIRVDAIENDAAVATVVLPGFLSGRSGVHIPGERLSLPNPTPRDLEIVDHFVKHGADMIAVSFVRTAEEVRSLGTEPHPFGPLVVTKIETRAAIENLPSIIGASSALMVARGDLGAECDLADLPHLQKRIIRESIAAGLPVITATQMLDSMVHSAMPTRAEASDVANAVFDGTSAVMLSAETAVGVDPPGVVRTMAELAERADEEFDHTGWGRRLSDSRGTAPNRSTVTSVTDAMTHASWRAVQNLGCKTLVCISGSGGTVRSMARFRPEARILGFTVDERTAQQLTLSWGVTPHLLDHDGTYEDRVNTAVRQARHAGEVRSGDLVAVLAGIDTAAHATDTLRIVRIP